MSVIALVPLSVECVREMLWLGIGWEYGIFAVCRVTVERWRWDMDWVAVGGA